MTYAFDCFRLFSGKMFFSQLLCSDEKPEKKIFFWKTKTLYV